MAIIYERQLFSWKNCDELGDLERLCLVLENIDDEDLVQKLEKMRKKRRNDYPIRPLWNSLLARIVFQHKSIASLTRELKRNAQLRELCGFDVLKGIDAVPTAFAYSRFMTKIYSNKETKTLIKKMFEQLVNELKNILPDFGQEVAFDGKAVKSHANGKNNSNVTNKRREHDADWGVKKYKLTKTDGTIYEKTTSWYGFKFHLIADANYELPIAFKVTKASTAEKNVIKDMFEDLSQKHPEIINRCEYAMGDRGYDSSDLIIELWERHKIKPIIDIRVMWKDGEKSQLLDEKKFNNVVYDCKGAISCYCLKTGTKREMVHRGFEKERNTLKYGCPAKYYGCECKGRKSCPVKSNIRISLATNKRLFTPVSRSSYKWKDLYNKRTSVERLNSRIETSFGFDKHYIRGLEKMELFCCLSLSVMLAMALGRAQENKMNLIRSLVRIA